LHPISRFGETRYPERSQDAERGADARRQRDGLLQGVEGLKRCSGMVRKPRSVGSDQPSADVISVHDTRVGIIEKPSTELCMTQLINLTPAVLRKIADEMDKRSWV
jgi:hypothetical protein